jgi:hypothetical protein
MLWLRVALLGAVLAAGYAASASADTSELGGGVANWFYNCANDQTMNVVIQHADRSTTEFSVRRGEIAREPVRRGDMAAWSCGNRRVVLGDQLRPIVKAR